MRYCKNLTTLSTAAVGIAACSSPDRNVHSENSGRLARQMPSKANPLSASRMMNRCFSVVGPKITFLSIYSSFT